MNIWILNHYGKGPGVSGGTRHYDLAKQLVKQGYCVTIFASSFSHQAYEDTRLKGSKQKVKEEYSEGVRFVWIKTKEYHRNDWKRVKNILDYSFRVYNYARKLEEKPDIVIGSLMHPLAPLVAYRLARKKKALFFFEERDLWPQTLIDLGNLSKYNPIVVVLSYLEKFLYRKANKIIVLFDKAVDYVEGRGINRSKVLYLPNGVDLSRFDRENGHLPLELETMINPIKNKFLAIYTGSHAKSDNLDSLLLAAKELNSKNQAIHFLFIGNGPEKQKLVKWKESWNLTNVTFLPAVPKEYIPVLLQQAKVGLVSLKDAELYKWGISFNKLYDYMAAKLPILLLSKRQESHLQKSGGGSIVMSSKEMADALIHLQKEKEKRIKLGENARRYVEQQHSWEILSKKLIAVFNEVDQERKFVSSRKEIGGEDMETSNSFGENVVLYKSIQFGKNVTIGNNVVIYEGTIIGNDVVIQDNAVIGKRPTKAKYSTLDDKQDLVPCQIGDGVVIGTSSVIYAGSRLKDSVYVADLATIRERVEVGMGTIVGRGVSIENDCHIGSLCKLETNCYITSHSTLHDHVFIAPFVVTSNDAFMGRTKERLNYMKGVTIQRGGRIGANAVILPGIEIEEEGVVAAGSIVTKNIKKRELVMGAPAKKVRDVPNNQLLEKKDKDND